MPYDINNPHPEFGKNPNIMDEFGRTHYPKYVTNKNGVRVIVKNPREEMEVTGKKVDTKKGLQPSKEEEKSNNDGWQ